MVLCGANDELPLDALRLETVRVEVYDFLLYTLKSHAN